MFELEGFENAPMEHPEATGVFRSLRLESDIPIVAYQFQPYSSSTIATADAALELLAHTAPILGVLDINLGQGRTSEPVANALQARAIPFMFVTGYDDRQGMRPHLRTAPRLIKPISGPDLARTLDMLLS